VTAYNVTAEIVSGDVSASSPDGISNWTHPFFGTNIQGEAQISVVLSESISYVLSQSITYVYVTASVGSAPVVSNILPTPGSNIQETNILSFDITDDSGQFKRIIIHAYFPTLRIKEVVHDGGFGPTYTDSANIVTVISGGYNYALRRDGGWPSNPTIIPYVIDISGSENS